MVEEEEEEQEVEEEVGEELEEKEVLERRQRRVDCIKVVAVGIRVTTMTRTQVVC